MVGGDHLDGLALHLATIIGNRHFDGGQRTLACCVGIKAGHVGENADLDDIVRDLRVCRSAGRCESEGTSSER